jgi:hypothetical protein
VVALLHTLWDASRGIAVWLTLLLTATQAQWALIQLGRVPQPAQAQVHTFTMINGTCCLTRCSAWRCCVAAGGRHWPWSTAQPAPRPPLDS